MAGYDVRDYLDKLRDQTLPPLLLEVMLKSGRSYYVKNAFRTDGDMEMVAIRVWDLRAVDVSSLPAKLNAVTDREEWNDFASIDPALDQANLWVRVDQIEGFTEWHERYWPVAEEEKTAAPYWILSANFRLIDNAPVGA